MSDKIGYRTSTPLRRANGEPFRYFNSSPEVIRLAVMMYVRFPLSFRNAEDLVAERGIVVRPCASGRITSVQSSRPRSANAALNGDADAPTGGGAWTRSFVRINGKQCYVWRAVDHEGDVLVVFVVEARQGRRPKVSEADPEGHCRTNEIAG